MSTYMEVDTYETEHDSELLQRLVVGSKHQSIKYACPCCDGSIKVMPAAPRIIPKLESTLVYGDETELQVLKEPGRAPQTKSYL